MRKILNFRYTSVLIIVILIFLLASCDKEDRKPEDAISESEETQGFYAYEFTDISLPLSVSFPVAPECIIHDDTLYFSGMYDDKIILLNADTLTEEGTITKSNVHSLAVDSEGNLWLLIVEYLDSTDPEFVRFTHEANYILEKINKSGETLALYDVEFLEDRTKNNPKQIALDSEGFLYILCGGISSCTVTVFSADAVDINESTIEFTLQTNTLAEMVATSDGHVIISDMNYDGYRFMEIDVSAKGWGKELKSEIRYRSIFGGAGSSIILDDGGNVWDLNWDTGETTKYFSMFLAGFGSARVLTQLPDKTLLIQRYNESDLMMTNPIIVRAEEKYFEGMEPVVLRLATLGGYQLRDMIMAFNRKSPTCKIDVLDYSLYDSEQDPMTGMNRMVVDIISGNQPDIYDLSTIPVGQYATRGLLEDLYPYIDEDPDIDRVDFVPNILTATETDGKLYELVPSFLIQTIIGRSDIVGDGYGWTFDEYFAVLERNKNAVAFGPSISRTEFLKEIITNAGEDFIDWSIGECSFDSENFRHLLELAKTFPVEGDLRYLEYGAIQEGRQLLTFTELNEFSAVDVFSTLFNGDISFVGLPGDQASGNVFVPNVSLGISSMSKHKDSAWIFLREFLLDVYQTSWYLYAFPSTSSALEVYMDRYKEMVLYDGDNRVSLSSGLDEMITLYTQNDPEYDIARTMELIENTNKMARYDKVLQDIVLDEAAAYFAGDKSVEETARLIQGRAQIYVNEQR